MIQLLLVDDEPIILENLASIPWSKIGIDAVYTATSAFEAIEHLQNNPIDIVVTDIRMPEMSGLQLCETIREHWSRTKCLLLSGYAEFEYAQQALRSQTADYLLKPIKNQDLLQAVERTLQGLLMEREEMGSQQKAMYALRSHLPFMRSVLLQDVLRGKMISSDNLAKQMEMLDIPFALEQSSAILMVRIDHPFKDDDERSLSLFEYSIANMAEEIMGPHYHVWFCTNEFRDLVFLVANRDTPLPIESNRRLLERLGYELQACVASYLRRKVSVLVSDWGEFPAQIAEMYRMSLSLFRKLSGSEQEFFIRLWDAPQQAPVQSLQRLYEPPTLLQFMEAGRWKEARHKLEHICEELSEDPLNTDEYRAEAYYYISNAMSYIAHLQGMHLSDVVGDQREPLHSPSLFRSTKQLCTWSLQLLQQIESKTQREARETHSSFVHKIQRYIEQHLSEDVSLQALAEHMFLHPAYISAMYKQETGGNLSDYIYRYRMERACYLLRNTKDKIYEIAEQLGYQYTPYFSKLFKNQYGVTPQEYREQQHS